MLSVDLERTKEKWVKGCLEAFHPSGKAAAQLVCGGDAQAASPSSSSSGFFSRQLRYICSPPFLKK